MKEKTESRKKTERRLEAMKAVIEELVRGKCFICKNECNPDSYCHISCAEAYTSKKNELFEKHLKEIKCRDDR